LNDTDPIVLRPERGGPDQMTAASWASTPIAIRFDRRELDQILWLYGKMVAAGEWRDYAVDFLKDRAVFSVFRRASEVPVYAIVKDPKLAKRQGVYSVVAAGGYVLRRGHDLARVLRVLDRPLRLVKG
jgi:hypothetical protein